MFKSFLKYGLNIFLTSVVVFSLLAGIFYIRAAEEGPTGLPNYTKLLSKIIFGDEENNIEALLQTDGTVLQAQSSINADKILCGDEYMDVRDCIQTASGSNIILCGGGDCGDDCEERTYQASTDFSTTQGQNNWYYQYWDGSSYKNMPAWKNVSGRPTWYPNINPPIFNIYGVPVNDHLYVWFGGGHPFSDDKPAPVITMDSVRTWMAPYTGKITITGNARDIDAGGGDGIQAIIRHNGTELWNKGIGNGDMVGKNFSLTDIAVSQGDKIYFHINPKSNDLFDSTFFDPKIVFTPTPGEYMTIQECIASYAPEPKELKWADGWVNSPGCGSFTNTFVTGISQPLGCFAASSTDDWTWGWHFSLVSCTANSNTVEVYITVNGDGDCGLGSWVWLVVGY